MVVSEISLYNALKSVLSEENAKTIVEGIKQEVKEEFENRREILATKEDIANLRVEMKSDKVDIIKWMFIFWIGTIGVLSGIMFAMLNAYLK